MARVLLVGIDPALVDFSDPSTPAGITAEMIRQGLVTGIADLRGAGHQPESLFIPTDPSRLDELAAKLAHDSFDCVLIGGGVRVPPRNLALFEAVLNVVARADPSPAIALVNHPGEALEAVSRVLGRAG